MTVDELLEKMWPSEMVEIRYYDRKRKDNVSDRLCAIEAQLTYGEREVESIDACRCYIGIDIK